MGSSRPYDAFLSYAVEDKIGIVNELDELLRNKGLKIWYAGRELKVGDSIEERINEGLEQCNYGVVIIIPTYLSKVWGLFELFTLQHMQKEVFIILHNIPVKEFLVQAPMLIDCYMLDSAKGIPYLAEKLYEEIISKPPPPPQVNWIRRISVALVIVLSLSGFYYGYTYYFRAIPSSQVVEQAIKKRISDLQQKADIEQQQLIHMNKSVQVDGEIIKKVFVDFQQAKSYYRNEYVLNTGLELIHSRTRVQKALEVNLDDISPLNQYSFNTPAIYRCAPTLTSDRHEEKYFFYNKQPITYSITEATYANDLYKVEVKYNNPVRLIQATLIFPSPSNDTKRHQVSFTALEPSETYSFQLKGANWTVKDIQ